MREKFFLWVDQRNLKDLSFGIFYREESGVACEFQLHQSVSKWFYFEV